MATYDNKYWLLSNIRNSFISTDDTGMCEIVMAGENFPKLFHNKALEEKAKMKDASVSKSRDLVITEIPEDDAYQKDIVTEYDPYPQLEDSDDEDLLSGSYIRHEDFGHYRQRSNSAQWYEKKEQALKKAAKIKVIKWENPSKELSNEEKSELFSKKEIPKLTAEKKKSLLSEQLKNCPDLPHRQYSDYAKFDGTAQLGLPTKSFKIFMTMLPEKHQNYPVNVCVIASAKIQDLIGFTCYKYSIEHPDIPLGSINKYGLYIAEDDGEVDTAFPCLDANEPCSKFGFTCLGLVDKKSKHALSQNVLQGGPGSIQEESFSCGFQMIFPKPNDSGHSIASRHNTGGSGTSEAVKYAILAVNEDNKNSDCADLNKYQTHILATEAPQYKTFRVQLLHKVRTNTPVQLGISLERIEIEPLINTTHFWSRSKYIMHSIDLIVWCQLMEAKSNKTTFRLVYTRGNNPACSDLNSSDHSFFNQHSSYKHHDFECDHDTAKEIVDKVNRILDLCNSPCRREYKTAKERKQQTRKSFHNPRHLN